MVGYARLRFAILVLQDDIASIWRWFARTLNAPPVPIAAALLHTALVMTGAAAQQRYGKQWGKIVAYIQKDYVPCLEAERAKCSGEEADRLRADQTKLRLWLEEFT